MNNVELHLTDAALDLIAQQALDKGTGARGLRSLMERCLTDVMYKVSDLDDAAASVVVDATGRMTQLPSSILESILVRVGCQ